MKSDLKSDESITLSNTLSNVYLIGIEDFLNERESRRFVVFPWVNYRELTVIENVKFNFVY